MKLEQAIKTALEFENNVYRIYEEAERQATDPVGQRVFSVLAKEELGHIEFLGHCLASWRATGKLTDAHLDTAIPSTERIAQGLDQLKERVSAKRERNELEIELLQRAIDAEAATSSYYKKMVSELDDDGQRLFARFVEIEEGHLAIVKAEMDSVTGLGYWFDMPEWQFQDG